MVEGLFVEGGVRLEGDPGEPEVGAVGDGRELPAAEFALDGASEDVPGGSGPAVAEGGGVVRVGLEGEEGAVEGGVEDGGGAHFATGVDADGVEGGASAGGPDDEDRLSADDVGDDGLFAEQWEGIGDGVTVDRDTDDARTCCFTVVFNVTSPLLKNTWILIAAFINRPPSPMCGSKSCTVNITRHPQILSKIINGIFHK